MIEDQLLPIIKEVLQQIKKRARDEDKEWLLLDQNLTKDHEEYNRLTMQLRKTLVGQQWKEGEKEGPKDPYVANLGILILSYQIQLCKGTFRIAIKSRKNTGKNYWPSKSHLAVSKKLSFKTSEFRYLHFMNSDRRNSQPNTTLQ